MNNTNLCTYISATVSIGTAVWACNESNYNLCGKMVFAKQDHTNTFIFSIRFIFNLAGIPGIAG